MQRRLDKHNDSTIIKHYQLYLDYKELCKKTKDEHPDFADVVARGYYYNILCKRHNLTPNYVCSIICRIMADEDNFKREVQRATFNLKD